MFKISLQENYRVVESSLSRIWGHISANTSFGVVSAYNHTYSDEAGNIVNHEQLRDILTKNKKGYIEQASGYSYQDIATNTNKIQKEKSFFIPDISLRSTLQLGRKFKQESILYKDEKGFGLYLCSTGKKIMEFLTKETVLSFQPKDIEIAYSALIKANHNHKAKFSYIAENYIPTNTDGYRAMKTKVLPLKGWICIRELYHEKA